MGAPSLLQSTLAISRIAANVKASRSGWRGGGTGFNCFLCHCQLLPVSRLQPHSRNLICESSTRIGSLRVISSIGSGFQQSFSLPGGICQLSALNRNFHSQSLTEDWRGGHHGSCRFRSLASRARGKASVEEAGGPEQEASAKEAPHIPVLLEEILSFFRGQNLSTFLDGTLGAGGHSSAIIREHPELQHLVALDVDPRAHAEATPNLSRAIRDTHGSVRFETDAVTDSHKPHAGPKLHILKANFTDLEQVLEKMGPEILGNGVDGFLFDLGMSSMQVDAAERGFSFMRDGPVDMRMNPEGPISAEDVVNEWSEAEIGRILLEYGEERRWRYLAQRIVEARGHQRITSTLQLVRIIGGRKTGHGLHPATRTFQALRIAVNDELGAIARALPVALGALALGGRIGVISFHSLEDRIVKRAFLSAAGKERPADEWGWGGGSIVSKNKYTPKHGRARFEVLEDQRDPLGIGEGGFSDEEAASSSGRQYKILTKRPVGASDEETARNGRSRSAKLRFIKRVR